MSKKGLPQAWALVSGRFFSLRVESAWIVITCNLVPFAFLQPSNECSTSQDVCLSDHKSKFDGSIKLSKVSQFMSSFIRSFFRSFVLSFIHSFNQRYSSFGPWKRSRLACVKCASDEVSAVLGSCTAGGAYVPVRKLGSFTKKWTARWENGRI